MADFIGMLASMGRGKDSQVAHVEPGEIIIPREVQDNQPQVVQAFIKAMKEAELNWRQFIVGSNEGSQNPETGLQEFLPARSVGLTSRRRGLTSLFFGGGASGGLRPGSGAVNIGDIASRVAAGETGTATSRGGLQFNRDVRRTSFPIERALLRRIAPQQGANKNVFSSFAERLDGSPPAFL